MLEPFKNNTFKYILMSHEEYVLKRNGKKEAVSFDKILNRIKNMSYDDLNINFTTLTIKIIDRLYNDLLLGFHAPLYSHT